VKNLSGVGRLMLTLAALLGVLAFIVIVDFGVNAGVVHQGVTVEGFDVGGLTVEEAQTALSRRRSALRAESICFTYGDFRACILPDDVGWFPDVVATAQRAFDVGRDGGPITALGDRARAWTGDADVVWPSGPRNALVTPLIREWRSELRALGVKLNAKRMRAAIRRSIVTLPRGDVPFPLKGE
jgi:hypothetical protein